MIFSGLLLNLLLGVGTLTTLWFVYIWKKNPAVVDLGWAVGLTLMGLIHHLMSGSPVAVKTLIAVLVLLWGLRLGGYLFWTRLRLGKKDARYESLQKKKNMPAPVFFMVHFFVQACFQTTVGFVFIFTAQSTEFHPVFTTLGLFLWCAGYAGSIAADFQLHRFRSNPANRGSVCQAGLWNVSRHPNYFFEILLWFGFAFMGLETQHGWLGFVSPLVLLMTMAFITGPISERQSLTSKPQQYRQYQKTTSMIVPWFKSTA